MNTRLAEIRKRLEAEGFVIVEMQRKRHECWRIERDGKAAILITSRSPRGPRAVKNAIALARRLTR